MQNKFSKSGKTLNLMKREMIFRKRAYTFLDILDRNVESDSDIDNAIQVLK